MKKLHVIIRPETDMYEIFEDPCNYESPMSDRAKLARLIAAAPELLEAVEAALNFIDRCGDAGMDCEGLPGALRAAIAKAKGESC